MKKNDYININYKKESKFNKMDIFEIDILGREIKFIEKEKSEAQLIPIKRRRGPRAAQHPSTLPEDGLSLWLKADVGVTLSGSNVTSWADQSGNNRNASEYSGSYPTYGLIGGKSFISFNAFVDLILSNPIWDTSIPFIGTIFTVARFPSSSAGGNARLFSAEANTNYFVFGRGIDSTNAFFVTNNQEDYVASSLEASNNTNYILEATFNEVDATIYLNGIQSGASGISSNDGIGNEFIGGGEEPSSIAEMVIYNRVLTTEERQQVEQYLNSKYQIYPWRITISGAGTTTSNGEYVWDGVTLSNNKPRYDKVGGVFDEDYIGWEIEPNNFWSLYDSIAGLTYISYNLITWEIGSDGVEPAPSGSLSYTP